MMMLTTIIVSCLFFSQRHWHDGGTSPAHLCVFPPPSSGHQQHAVGLHNHKRRQRVPRPPGSAGPSSDSRSATKEAWVGMQGRERTGEDGGRALFSPSVHWSVGAPVLPQPSPTLSCDDRCGNCPRRNALTEKRCARSGSRTALRSSTTRSLTVKIPQERPANRHESLHF